YGNKYAKDRWCVHSFVGTRTRASAFPSVIELAHSGLAPQYELETHLSLVAFWAGDGGLDDIGRSVNGRAVLLAGDIYHLLVLHRKVRARQIFSPRPAGEHHQQRLDHGGPRRVLLSIHGGASRVPAGDGRPAARSCRASAA